MGQCRSVVGPDPTRPGAARRRLRAPAHRTRTDAAMTTTDLIPPAAVVDAAIARVLDAEHAARAAVAEAGETAAAMTEAARAAARELAARTERRILGVRAAFEEQASAAVAALDATAAATSVRREFTPDELARVAAAVATLAGLLTESGR